MDLWENYNATEKFGRKIVPWMLLVILVHFFVVSNLNSRDLNSEKERHQSSLFGRAKFEPG